MPDTIIVDAICPYLVLGLAPEASTEEVAAAYATLSEIFSQTTFMSTPQSWVQAQQICLNVENAYRRIIEEADAIKSSSQINPPQYPKLGQMLIAARLISLTDLEQAINKQKKINLPVGEILKEMSLITQEELDCFLLQQHVMPLPTGSPYLFGQRLIGLGLVTDDMIKIALIEQNAINKLLGEILVERKWLAPEIYAALQSASFAETV